MKKILLLLSAIILPLSIFSQSTIQWQKSLGGSDDDEGACVREVPGGGYIVAGYALSNDGNVSGNHGAADYWVVRLDAVGGIVWQKCLGGTDIDMGAWVQPTNDSGFVVAGHSQSTDGDVTGNHGSNDFWVVKLDRNGFILWQKSYGGSGDDQANSIYQTNDHGYIIAGYSSSTDGQVTGNHGNKDYWLVKTDSAGNPQWQKSLGGSGDDQAHSVQQTLSGEYIVSGTSNSNDGNVTGNHSGSYDYWVAYLNMNGNLQWQKSLGGTGIDFCYSVTETAPGGYIVCGQSQSTDGDVTGNNGFADYWIVKLTSLGNIQWQTALGGASIDYGYEIEQTIDGGYIATGYSYSAGTTVTGNHGGTADFWVVKLNFLGGVTWQKCYGGFDYDIGYSVHQCADNSFIATGYSTSVNGDVTGNHGNADYWVVKLDDATGIDENNADFPLAVFPDPASEKLTVQFPAEKFNAQDITLKIAAAQGTLVYQNNFTVNANEKTATVDISKLTSGVYFVSIFSGNKRYAVKKFVKGR